MHAIGCDLAKLLLHRKQIRNKNKYMRVSNVWIFYVQKCTYFVHASPDINPNVQGAQYPNPVLLSGVKNN